MVIEYDSIIERLYSEYYLQNRPSEVTSSYWQEQLTAVNVLKNGNDFIMAGVGYGTALPRTLPIYAENLFSNVLLRYLFYKYDIDKSIKICGLRIARRQKRMLDFNCVKQMLCANLIFKNSILGPGRTAVVIGDGYGFMTSLIKMRYPQTTVICVNLGKVLIFDAAYTKMACPGENCSLIDKKEELNNAGQGSVLFLEADKYELLYSLPIGLFINISSMQEMDKKVIKTYFDIMRSSTVESLFYSCNRIEKQLPDGAIIRFDDYPWDEMDKIIVNEKCPWCQKYPINKPPFWRRLDGPTQHRLVKLYRRS